MKLQLKLATVKTPCFIGGKNHGLTLDPCKNTELELEYNKDEHMLYATYRNETVMIPDGDIARMIEGVPTPKYPPLTHPIVSSIAHTAQVETPMSHVHAGHGHGKTGLGGKVK